MDAGLGRLRWPARRAEAAFAPEPSAPASARRFADRLCAEWQVEPARATDVVLVVSELVTNVLLHARTPIVLALTFDGTQMLVTLVDGTPAVPAPREAGADDEGGRGVAIITAIADDWGTMPTPVGKAVWALVTAAPTRRPDGNGDPAGGQRLEPSR